MTFTVGDLRRQLQHCRDDDELIFQGGLTFYRIKTRGPHLEQIEFSESVGYLTDEFKERNPHVSVAFIPGPSLAPGQAIGPPFDVAVH